MAKGSFATGTLSGKLGAYVFMRRKGEQISRSYVKPLDAKTRAQGVQRSSLSNIIRMYQSSPDFFKSAFQNKPINQSDYNAFVSRNLRRTPSIYIPKVMSDGGGSVVAPYVISDGSLQPIVVTGVGVDAKTNISLGEGFVIDETTTVGALTVAILSNNTFLEPGDQISYLSLEQYSYLGYPRLRSRKYEMILNASSETLVLSVMPVQAVAVVGGFLGHGPLVYSGAFAWLYSRNSPTGLNVSKQYLTVTSESLYSPYVGDDAATRASSSYGDGTIVFLNPNTDIAFANQPSGSISIASVTLRDKALSGGASSVLLNPGGSIAASALVIKGSGLSAIDAVELTVGGTSILGEAVASQTVTAALTVTGNTSAVNTAALAVGDISQVSSLVIKYGGETIFSWISSTGNENDNPLG